MTIKVQCECGTRYSFEVEPQGGVMPMRVTCPACNADGTNAANQFIAQSNPPAQTVQPRLRMANAPVAAAAAPAPPEDLPPPQAPRPGARTAIQKIEDEKRSMRRTGLLFGAAGLVVLALIGAYGWYSFVGCKPRLVYSVKLDSSQPFLRTQFLPGGRILLAGPTRVILHDIHTRADVWTAALPDQTNIEARPPNVYVDKENAWLCTGGQVVRVDLQTGQVKPVMTVTGQFSSFTPTESGFLVVAEVSESKRIATEIDRATAESTSRTIEVPRALKHPMPDELPPNVQPTAGVLLAQAMDEQKFNKPLDAVSSEFFSAGRNMVELWVTLLKPNVTWVKSIKPRGPSLVNGATTASTSATDVAKEVFNDIKRDQTGGVKSIDESTYEVRLRRWLADQPVEWKGNVTGVPAFFSLQTVDLIVAGKGLTVFDKQNTKLFEAQLSYPIGENFEGEFGEHSVPAVERAGVLYFYDQGVLTAFSLPGGEVQWRLTSVGISRVQFDDAGFLYLDTTAGSPEDIQYSDEIKLQATPAVVMKVDPHLGKILWQVQNLGQYCCLSGKYVYTSSAEPGGVALAVGLADALNAPRPEGRVYYHIYRLDPDTGKVLWKFYREEAPDDEAFQDNNFVLRFGTDLQVWKYLTF